jgi:hypothetical protein
MGRAGWSLRARRHRGIHPGARWREAEAHCRIGARLKSAAGLNRRNDGAVRVCFYMFSALAEFQRDLVRAHYGEGRARCGKRRGAWQEADFDAPEVQGDRAARGSGAGRRAFGYTVAAVSAEAEEVDEPPKIER